MFICKCYVRYSYREAERCYRRENLKEIEQLCVQDPKEFWNNIKQLGPKKLNDIPMRVVKDNETITEHKSVLETWKTDFTSLYNTDNNLMINDDLYLEAQSEVISKERDMANCLYLENVELNHNINEAELVKNLKKLKNKKVLWC